MNPVLLFIALTAGVQLTASPTGPQPKVAVVAPPAEKLNKMCSYQAIHSDMSTAAAAAAWLMTEVGRLDSLGKDGYELVAVLENRGIRSFYLKRCTQTSAVVSAVGPIEVERAARTQAEREYAEYNTCVADWFPNATEQEKKENQKIIDGCGKQPPKPKVPGN